MGDYERIRLVTLGGASVGKSAIVKRFLFSTFTEKYKPTVEDLYNQEYDFGSTTLKVDILDTAGDLQFPAMRRLSIATAHAFLIVFAVDNRMSFEMVKGFFEEIQEQRADFQDIPIVIAGNKVDLPPNMMEIRMEQVLEWIKIHWPSLRVQVVECSAKESLGIKEVFRAFLTLSRPQLDTEEGLKRRSSAHAASKSPARQRFPSTSSSPVNSPVVGPTPCPSGPGTPTKGGLGPQSAHMFQQFLTEESAFNRQKPRSRSLIRRSSKKVKQQVRDASGGPGDCGPT